MSIVICEEKVKRFLKDKKEIKRIFTSKRIDNDNNCSHFYQKTKKRNARSYTSKYTL